MTILLVQLTIVLVLIPMLMLSWFLSLLGVDVAKKSLCYGFLAICDALA